MNALESQIHYPLGEALPAPGTTLEVAPGVKWLRMGLPFVLDHINLWLLRDRIGGVDGWTVVDCCITHDESKAQWEQIFATQLEGLPVLRVIVTHMHPDHVGLAHWLCERWSAPLWMSATDYYVARLSTLGTTGFGGEAAARYFASHGLNEPATVEQIRNRANYYPSLVPAMPMRFVRLMDGGTLSIGGRRWRCISGFGHAPEHMALYGEDLQVLISGDMVLPRISTNVSVYDIEPEANSLTLFLQSIDKFLALPPGTLVLPSHGKPFGGAGSAQGEGGLHTRIRQLHAHHRDRLDEVLQACGTRPQSAADILPVMFKRPLDLHQTTFAMGEAVAHLHALWFEGRLTRTLDADGVLRFAGTAPTSAAPDRP